MDTDILCFQSKIKMDQIKKATKEYDQEKVHFIKTNFIIKCYKECNRMLQMSEETQSKVNHIIKTKKLQKFIKLKGKNEEVVSLFGLSDSKISSLYGDAALELKEKEYLKKEINCQLLLILRKDSSDELIRCFEKNGKYSSFLDSKLKTVRLMESLQSKIITCQKLLHKTQGYLDHLVILRRSNESKIKDNHIGYIIDEAEYLSLTAKILKSKIEDAMLSENEDIVRAMDILQDDVEKQLVEDTIKLRQLQTLSKEYKEIEGTKFQYLLNVYLQLLGAIKNSNNVLNFFKS